MFRFKIWELHTKCLRGYTQPQPKLLNRAKIYKIIMVCCYFVVSCVIHQNGSGLQFTIRFCKFSSYAIFNDKYTFWIMKMLNKNYWERKSWWFILGAISILLKTLNLKAFELSQRTNAFRYFYFFIPLQIVIDHFVEYFHLNFNFVLVVRQTTNCC